MSVCPAATRAPFGSHQAACYGPATVIEVFGLCKNYGTLRAVRDLSFTIGRGEVVGFLGPNGAGKTTTLRILAGFLGPSSGQVRIAGFDVFEEPIAARRRLGYMPEHCPAYPEMRVREYLAFRAQLKRVSARSRQAAVQRVMERVHLAHRAETLIGHLSKGYRQRLGLADALLGDPDLLILDEPTSGLDPNQVLEVRHVIRELAEEHTVLLSTHILTEVEMSCSRALVIHEGQLVAQGTIEALRERRAAARAQLLLRVNGVNIDDLQSLIEQRQQMDGVERWVVHLDGDRLQSVEAWVAELVKRGLGVLEATAYRATLEEVFVLLTRDAPQAPAAQGAPSRAEEADTAVAAGATGADEGGGG